MNDLIKVFKKIKVFGSEDVFPVPYFLPGSLSPSHIQPWGAYFGGRGGGIGLRGRGGDGNKRFRELGEDPSHG